MARVKIIGVPMDLGASRRGVDMGPSAMRIARIGPLLEGLGHGVVDAGNIEVRIAEAQHYGATQEKFASQIADACRRLSAEAYSAMREGTVPLVLGGDHSIAIGTVAGVSRYFREEGQRIGI